MKQHEEDMELSFAVARSKDRMCGICMEVNRVWSIVYLKVYHNISYEIVYLTMHLLDCHGEETVIRTQIRNIIKL